MKKSSKFINIAFQIKKIITMQKVNMIFKLTVFIIFIHLITTSSFAQNKVTGTFTQLAGQEVRLEGFKGFNTYVISNTTADTNGNFTLFYQDEDQGMGYVVSKDNQPFILVLSGEEIELRGESPGNAQSVEVVKGKENQLFGQYASEHPRREQALSAWIYLERIYTQDSLFAVHHTPQQAIEKEKQRIRQEDSLFLATLQPDMYVSWFLPVRKLVSSVSTIAQYRTEEIPGAIEAFRELDYTDPRMYKSGLLRDALDSHVWLIENSGRPLDSVFTELNISIDHMLENLYQDEQKFNEITQYLFELLEKRSLFGSSEYLAIKLLNESTCTLDADLANQMEQYRKMKKGNIAPDFSFPENVIMPGHITATTLKEIPSDYKVVVFAAGWCGHCRQELPAIARLYEKWKEQGVEVIFVSLDETEQEFQSFAGDFPFVSLTDFKKWDSPIVQDYHIFATPTIYLLDKDLQIILRPHSVKQMDSWVDWHLVKGSSR